MQSQFNYHKLPVTPFEGTVSSDLPCKDGNAQFTIVPFKAFLNPSIY